MKKDLPLPLLHDADPEVATINDGEELRQLESINFIPSENYASPAVREASASVFTNKYSEGYPDARYYPGNEYVDEIEKLAQARALAAFGLTGSDHRSERGPAEGGGWSVNVQPYSGSPANLAIYKGLMEQGDIALGMKLDQGGHLTHGYKLSASGTFFHFEQYGVGEDELIDFDQVEQLAQEHKPKLIVCGATAYPRVVDFERFGAIAKNAGAYLVADVSHISGLIAGGAHPSPFPHADIVMTTTHKALRGPRGAVIFAKGELIKNINKAIIPGLQGGPHNNTTAAIAVMFKETTTPTFKEYAHQIVKNAQALADDLVKRGYRLTSGGTDNHLFLMDFRDTKLSGGEVEQRLEAVHITANRNTVPGDPRKPFDPSGVRFGTPSVTTRGMKEPEMAQIAEFIDRAIKKEGAEKVAEGVKALARKFPPPGFSA
ncbi:MAG: serine hydroxymethyltransferase [Candidatus Spechtbacterales bacterium]